MGRLSFVPMIKNIDLHLEWNKKGDITELWRVFFSTPL